jgi:hypothetical protein
MYPLKDVKIGESLYGFGPRIKYYLPTKARIPKEFFNPANKWNALSTDWWKNGLNKNLRFFVRDGLSNETIKKYIGAVLNTHGDFIAKDYKIAAGAFLLAQWLESFTFINEV